MHLPRFLFLFILAVPIGSQLATRNALQLWFLLNNDATSDQSVQKSKALLDRAAAAGYTGVILWDGAFDTLEDPNGSADDVYRLQSVIKHAASKHFKILATAVPASFALHPEWAEVSRVIGSQFRVNRAKRRLDFINTFRGLQNGDFESGRAGWFEMGDEPAVVDSQVAHGGRSSGVVKDAKGNGRFRQKLDLKPWRQYHLRLFFKTQDFHGFTQTEVLSKEGILPLLNSQKTIFQATLSADGTHDWTQVDYMFNSGEDTEAYLYFGVWGGSSGAIWFDDVSLEETALVYLLRSPRAPFRVYNPAHPETTYKEHAQYEDVADPRMTEKRPFHDVYHAPPTVLLPPWTHLPDGLVVAMDYYAVFPIPQINGVSMCLTDASILKWLKDDAKAIRKVLPAGAGIMMQYDEIRQMNSCAECRARHMTAGELLAWNVGQVIQMFRSSFPEGVLYTWNDMFDPYHNAVKNYFYVEGDLSGSWKALPADVTIMNWNLDHLRSSLIWFSGSDPQQPVAHEQVIAGFYDRRDAAAEVTQELQQARGIPGIRGVMYTTWVQDYKQLENFAQAARANWPAYVASVSRN